VEDVSAGDKFSIFGFLGLLAFLSVFGLWLWSAKDLIGNFVDNLGFWDKKGMIELSESMNESVGESGGSVGNGNTFIVSDCDGEDCPQVTRTARSTEQEEELSITKTIDILPTSTYYPTYTPYPTYTVVPEDDDGVDDDLVYMNNDYIYVSDLIRSEVSGVEPDGIYKGFYSYYWPPLGGINCDVVDGVEECEYMANGQKVKDYVGVAWACPEEIEFGSYLYIVELDLYGVCKDRGEMIVCDDDGCWFDHLISSGLMYWGTEINVEVYEN